MFDCSSDVIIIFESKMCQERYANRSLVLDLIGMFSVGHRGGLVLFVEYYSNVYGKSFFVGRTY